MTQAANKLGVSVTELVGMQKNGKLGQFVQRDWFNRGQPFVWRNDIPAIKDHIKAVAPSEEKEVWLTLKEVADKCNVSYQTLVHFRNYTGDWPQVEEKRGGYNNKNVLISAVDLPKIVEAVSNRVDGRGKAKKTRKNGWKPGQPGNPAGRPKREAAISSYTEAVKSQPNREVIALELLKAGYHEAAAYLVK